MDIAYIDKILIGLILRTTIACDHENVTLRF